MQYAELVEIPITGDLCGLLDDPDNCPTPSDPKPRFVRGDSNADAAIDISDAVVILSHLFTGGTAPPCRKAADVDDSGIVDISDGVALLSHLFLSGEAPPDPFAECGVDLTADELTCESFPPCP